jgi:3-methyladenine DNA glycosylase/8-oxoguanine DNA glycosylase
VPGIVHELVYRGVGAEYHRGFQRTSRLCPAWGIAVPTPKALDALGDSLRPYRSVVAYYTWKVSADPDLFATSSVREVS